MEGDETIEARENDIPVGLYHISLFNDLQYTDAALCLFSFKSISV